MLEAEADPFGIPYRPILQALTRFVEREERNRQRRSLAIEVGSGLFKLVPVLGPLGKSLGRILERTLAEAPRKSATYADVALQLRRALRTLAAREEAWVILDDVERYDASILAVLSDLLDDSTLRCR